MHPHAEGSPVARLETGGVLVIDWPDGHQSRYEPAVLRAHCPCAACREEREAAGRGRAALEPPAAGSGSCTLTGVEPVGRYGLAPRWGDGHAAGIFHWAELRGLCDCFQCRLERGTR